MPRVFGQLVYWHDPRLVHPEDQEGLQRAHPFGLGDGNGVGIFEIERRENGYLFIFIRRTGATYRFREEAFRPFPPPKFSVGDKVRTLNGTPRTGWVADIGWHFAKSKPVYFLEVQGRVVPRKKVSRRYFEEDLELVVG